MSGNTRADGPRPAQVPYLSRSGGAVGHYIAAHQLYEWMRSRWSAGFMAPPTGRGSADDERASRFRGRRPVAVPAVGAIASGARAAAKSCRDGVAAEHIIGVRPNTPG